MQYTHLDIITLQILYHFMDFQLSGKRMTELSRPVNQTTDVQDQQETTLPGFIMNHFDFIRISFFQFIGTLFFAYGICCSQYQPPPHFPKPIGFQQSINPAHSAFVSFSLYLGILFCGQFSGGHCNPAVTTVFFLQKKSGITFYQYILYIVSQIAGAFVGSIIAFQIVDNLTAPIIAKSTLLKLVWVQFAGQFFGTLIFTFIILLVTTKQTTFINSTFSVYWMIIVGLYIGRTFSFRTEGLNPALAVGMELAFAIFNNRWDVMADCWALIVGPFLGAVASSIIFQYFYKPILTLWKFKTE